MIAPVAQSRKMM
jgi:hypothetical protein